MIPVTATLSIDDSEISESFIRGAVPWPSRSSGTKAAPRLRRSVTER